MRSLAFIATSMWLISCTGEKVTDSTTRKELPETQSHAIPEIAWARLAGAKIYFGHQSVGANILEGLRDQSARRNGNQLRIVDSSARTNGTPALVEFRIGENGRPESKMKDFSAVLSQIPDTARAIALFKYCYLDFTATTDVEVLFAKHRTAVREMRVRHPNLTFVHVTTPLTRLESGPGYVAKRILGKPTTREANANRNRFNALLRGEYDGEPFFDLAEVESTRANGSRSFFRNGSTVVYTLAQELTDDGGHLNAAGRRAAAAEFAAVIERVVAGW